MNVKQFYLPIVSLPRADLLKLLKFYIAAADFQRIFEICNLM